MNCFCPKCNATISPDFKEVPDGGTFHRCPECNAGFSLQKESFAKRALHKGTDVSCAECGSTLGATIYCQHCHTIYPDYHVTERSSAAKQKLGKILASLKGSKQKTSSSSYYHLPGERKSTSSPSVAKVAKLASNPLQLIFVSIVLVALIGGGGFVAYQNKIESDYAVKYVRALFFVKTAADVNIRLSTKRIAEWRSNQLPTAPAYTADEMNPLSSGRSDVDSLLNRLEEPPKKMIQSRDALKKLQESYLRLYRLNASPPGTLDSYATSAKKFEDEFKKTGKELKSAMPERISEQFDSSLDRYKNLKDL